MRWARLRRWLVRLIVVLSAAILVALVLTTLTLATRFGRNLALGYALVAVNRAIPGRVAVADFSELGLHGLELTGVSVFDPTGKRVLEVKTLRLEADFLGLRPSTLRVERVSVKGGSVDLREVAATRRGLVAAFVDPAAPPSAPRSAPLPYVLVRVLEVEGFRATLPRPAPALPTSVEDLRLLADFELDGGPRANVRRLTFHAERERERWLTVSRFEAHLGRRDETSSMKLEADAAGAAIALSAKGVLPGDEHFEAAPVSLELAISRVTAARLATLAADPGLAQAFSGEVAVRAKVAGSLAALVGNVVADTNGGQVTLDATLADREHLAFELVAQGIRAGRVVSGAPPEPVTAALSGSVELPGAKAAAGTPALGKDELFARVRVRRAKLGDEVLPDMDLRAIVSATGVRDLDLDAEDGVSELSAKGRVGFASDMELELSARVEPATLKRLARLVSAGKKAGGHLKVAAHVSRTKTGYLTVTADLTGRDLALDDLSLARLDAHTALKGDPPRLSGKTRVEIADLRAGEATVHGASLAVTGGPEHYRVTLGGRSNQGDLDLLASVNATSHDLVIEASGRGTRAGHELELAVARTHVALGGSVETQGVSVSFAGQALTLRGRLAPERSELVIDATSIDLGALASMLPADLKPQGHVTLHGALRGELARPELELNIAATSVKLGDRPALDTWLDARLDAPAGTASVELRATDVVASPAREHRLLVELAAESHFATGVPLSRALGDAEHRVHLELDALDLSLVHELAPAVRLPVSGSLHAELDANGTLEAPHAELALDGTLKSAGSPTSYRVAQRASLDAGHFEARLTVDDAKGALFTAFIDATPPSFSRLAADPAHALDDTPFHVMAALAGRKLRELPLPGAASLPNAVLGASLLASHEPGHEPTVELTASLRQEPVPGETSACDQGDIRLDAGATLHEGRFDALVSGTRRDEELLRVSVGAELALADAFSGGEVRLGKISARASSRDLALESLPVVCAYATGTVSMHAEVSDPLGRDPHVDVGLVARGFSAGSTERLDAKLDLGARSDHARLDAEIVHGRERSTVFARVPLRLRDGKASIALDAPIEGRMKLVHLPLEPFLNPKGAISLATGTLSGRVTLGGTLAHPKLGGRIDLEKVGFTATDAAQPLRDVGGRLVFTEREIRLEHLVAHDKDGSLVLDGRLDLENLQRVKGDFTLKARDFPLRQQGQVVAITQLDAHVTSTVTPRTTSVRVELGQIDTWLESAELRSGIDLEGHPDVVVNGVPAREPTDGPTAPDAPPPGFEAGKTAAPRRSQSSAAPQRPELPGTRNEKRMAPRTTTITLDARNHFWIKRKDFAVKLAALLDVRVQGEAVRVEGKVDLDRGYLELFGKVFEIQRGGYLEFIGSPEPDPVLQIEAVHQNRRSAQKVSVRITGRGSAPELAFFIDDEAVTAGDAFIALFGGQRSNQDPKGGGEQARQFVGGLTAGILATTARRELGAAAPILMVDPGGDDEESRVRAGFELDSLVPGFLKNVVTGVYFEGIVSNGKSADEKDANVHGGALLEIYFPRDFFTAGQYGPGTTWSLNVGWQPY